MEPLKNLQGPARCGLQLLVAAAIWNSFFRYKQILIWRDSTNVVLADEVELQGCKADG